ncbi:hypothetical protein CHRY9393_01260 [Chryseobacterium fistulae]|uniref:Uncharacterized protein n=1 Tax=Chryseobacterium fistulae TaxID=2675058 RepID=A0A6N4XTJ7_9FLAO|nr:hypothetical protein CHRY9393_01260 [Chryseobacterium fistulae]
MLNTDAITNFTISIIILALFFYRSILSKFKNPA